MAARAPSVQLMAILATVIALSSSLRSPEAMGMDVATYWGQTPTAISLKAVCDTKYFSYINLAHLKMSADGPTLDLNGTTCDVGNKACRHLTEDILHCQRQGIKVLLSIQINGKRGNQLSPYRLADIVQQNYLSGYNYAPLGNVSLDGVNFHVEKPYPEDRLYWSNVADILSRYSEFTRKIYLAAAPMCAYPDKTLNDAIQAGIINYVWVQFYNDATCDYSGGGVENVLGAWNKWNEELPESSKLFMGLPTDPDNVQSGYVPSLKIALCVLPRIYTSENYGGFMLPDFIQSIDCVPESEQAPTPPFLKMITES